MKKILPKDVIVLSLFFLLLFVLRELVTADQKMEFLETKRGQDQDIYTFFVLGDAGSGNEDQKAVALWMENRCQKLSKLDGILLLGDNIYPNGVKSVNDPAWEAIIEEPYGSSCLKKTSIYPTLGNHDYKLNPQAQIDYTHKGSHWFMPHRFYSLVFGDLLNIVAFDSNVSDFCFNSQKCSLDFIFNKLLSDRYKWKFVIAHHPLTSASKKNHNYSGKNPLSYILRPFVCRQVDAWFSGHAHHLEQRRLKDCRTNFFISGGGGGHLDRPYYDQEESLFVAREFGFIEIQVTKNHLTSRFISENKVLYERVQTKLE